MFSFFFNKAKKIEQKLSILAMEIASIQKNIIFSPNESTYKNLHLNKTKELNILYNDLESVKGKSYVDDFIRKLTNEYKQSEYVLSKEEQKKLERLISEGSTVLREIDDLQEGLKETVKAVAEELQIKQFITIDILINRSMKERKRHIADTEKLQNEVDKEYVLFNVAIYHNEFEGGDFYLNNQLIPIELGEMIEFDADMVHSVSKVTKGNREVLVAWVKKSNKNKIEHPQIISGLLKLIIEVQLFNDQ